MVTAAINLVRCPECGQPVPHLTPQQVTIYNALKKRPRSVGQLHDLLYLHVPDNPPSIKIVHTLISQANRVLKSRGLRIRSIEGMYYLTGEVENA